MTQITPRLPVLKVGAVTLNAAGGAHLEGWEFDTRLSDGNQVNLDPVNGGLAGWDVLELHAIAHGAPCDCPIGQLT